MKAASAVRHASFVIAFAVALLTLGRPGVASGAELERASAGGGAGVVATDGAPFELQVPVLFYHHVRCPPEGTTGSDLYICPADFEAQMAALVDHGWHTITADELADLLAARSCPAPRSVVVSFDDGPIDQYTDAAPILERHGLRGTFFAIAHRSGKPIEMSYDQMRDLVARGHAIGNHTLSHANLRLLDRDGQVEQIEGAQELLDSELGFRPRTIAYPYGRYSQLTLDVVAASGLELGFTVHAGAREATSGPYTSPRIDGALASPAKLLAKIEPFADGCPPTRADLAAALAPTGPYKGLNVYSSTVIRRQTVSRRDVQVGHEYGYTVVLRNQSNEPGSIRLKAQQGGRAAASVRYFLDGVEVTAAITGTGSQTAVLAPWAAKSLLVTIKPLAPRVAGSAVKVDIRGSPVSTPAAVDVVRLKARL